MGKCVQQPVAWLSIDCIGERYLCFSEPIDNDEKLALYTVPPVPRDVLLAALSDYKNNVGLWMTQGGNAPDIAAIADRYASHVQPVADKFLGASTKEQIFHALDGAHWLGGAPHERIALLIDERNALKDAVASQPEPVNQHQASAQRERIAELEENACAHALAMKAGNSMLQAETERADKAEADRDHWKANHDNQVERARFLIERGDIPVERVRAYQRMQELEQGNAMLVLQANALHQAANAAGMNAGEDVTNLPAVVAALREDKERLYSGCILTHELDDFGQGYDCLRNGVNLRAGIDAAMVENGKKCPPTPPAAACKCAECGKQSGDGWALYCVACIDKHGLGAAAGYAQGVEAVAKLLEKKADDYASENGYDDMGGLSFGGGRNAEAKRDYHSGLLELAEEIRAMPSAAPAQGDST